MTSGVSFVDTSILCNILPIPGRDQDRKAVVEELWSKRHAGEALILPVAAVIEAGNFIAHLADGHSRRIVAQKFSGMLELVIKNEAPWKLHQFTWGDSFLKELIDGGGTGVTLIDHAVREMGAGDLCILAERKIYAERTGLSSVKIWTKDYSLASYC
ncbi:MAG: hypothetical protein ACRDRS_05175 [Pseudonocardiaceae bacterium]